MRYILEGSVRRSENRIRITAQLIEAESAGHLWAERYDRRIDDLFDLQDEITEAIAGRIEPEIRRSEARRGARRPTESLAAYDCYYQGIAQIHALTPDGLVRGRELLARALQLDPDFAAAHAAVGWSYMLLILSDPKVPWDEISSLGLAASETAHTLDDADPFAQVILAVWLLLVTSRVDESLCLTLRALESNPNFAMAWQFRGRVHIWRGEADEAIACIERAMRLSPNDPFGYLQQTGMGFAHFFAGRYDEALHWGAMARKSNPRYLPAHGIYAATAATLGRMAEAAEARDVLARADTEATVSWFDTLSRTMHEDARTRLLDVLRLAGLPE